VPEVERVAWGEIVGISRNLDLMTILIPIALAWLLLAALFALLCRVAALGDSAPPPEMPADTRASTEELLRWEEISGIALFDLRPDESRSTTQQSRPRSRVG
jgi:hypothetical protein